MAGVQEGADHAGATFAYVLEQVVGLVLGGGELVAPPGEVESS